ncbi:pyridoxal phosphate-dependent aminotransferase [Chloroflexota bacterium]
MPFKPRPEITDLQTAPHGGISPSEMNAMGLDPVGVLDFSVCTNPFMPPPGFWERLGHEEYSRYPDSGAISLTDKLGGKLGVSAGNILVGAGTTELIRLLAFAYFRSGDRVALLTPTFGEYSVAARIMGAHPVEFPLMEKDGFTLDDVAFSGFLRDIKPRGVFICNPGNPTGRYIPITRLRKIAISVPETLFIIDEAYAAFADTAWPPSEHISPENVVLLRSMTKDYGLAGLRLGYALADVDIIANLRRVCPPWNVNAAALSAGALVLGEDTALKQSLAKVREMKEFLLREFARLGLSVIPSDVHYFLVNVGAAGGVRRALLEHGVLVRDCSSFGLPGYIRVSPRPFEECEKLVQAISTVIKENRNT